MFDLSYYFYRCRKLTQSVFPDFASYFNSYQKISPERTKFIQETARAEPGFTSEELDTFRNPDGSPELVLVTLNNYPKLQQAIEAECTFRNIPLPACYIDMTGGCLLGHRRADIYSFLVSPEAYDIFSENELRALVA